MLKNYVNEVEEISEYSLEFTYKDDERAGFSFPCNSLGEVLPNMNPCAHENYIWCLDHPEKFSTFKEFTVNVRHVRNRHGTCSCGTEVELYDQYYGACECPKCGRWYNLFGQELLPPDQWETDPSDEEYW